MKYRRSPRKPLCRVFRRAIVLRVPASSVGRAIGVAVVLAFSACSLTGPQNQSPMLSVTQPASQLVVNVGDTVLIAADASDPDGSVAVVRFFVDGSLLGLDETSPYQLAWDTREVDGWQHEISVTALDDRGAPATRSVTVFTSWAYRVPEEVEDGWETSALESEGMDAEPLVAMMNLIRQHADHRIHGILIARHGRLVFEEYFDGYRRDDQTTQVEFGRSTVHDLASCTKSFTSSLLGIAIGEGIVESVEEPVAEFFPEFDWLPGSPNGAITLEHFINMASGIQWDQHTYAPLDPRNDLMQFGRSANPWQFYLSRPLTSQPGSTMNYSEASANVVGESIARASGLPLDDFASQRLFSPLGIHVSSWSHFANGSVWASGNLFLRPRDILKFGQLYLQGGEWQGEPVVPRAWVERLATPYHLFGPWSMDHERYWLESAEMIGYKDAWWLLNPASYGAGGFAANGWGGQRIFVLPAYDMVVVTTGGSQFAAPLLEPHEIMVRYVLRAVR